MYIHCHHTTGQGLDLVGLGASLMNFIVHGLDLIGQVFGLIVPEFDLTGQESDLIGQGSNLLGQRLHLYAHIVEKPGHFRPQRSPDSIDELGIADPWVRWLRNWSMFRHWIAMVTDVQGPEQNRPRTGSRELTTQRVRTH